eukprot:m.55626 g.55626  ORF g.55626 m.55626 type:complete len:552 (-) comp12961_c2_seq1:239-1894(-)
MSTDRLAVWLQRLMDEEGRGKRTPRLVQQLHMHREFAQLRRSSFISIATMCTLHCRDTRRTRRASVQELCSFTQAIFDRYLESIAEQRFNVTVRRQLFRLAAAAAFLLAQKYLDFDTHNPTQLEHVFQIPAAWAQENEVILFQKIRFNLNLPTPARFIGLIVKLIPDRWPREWIWRQANARCNYALATDNLETLAKLIEYGPSLLAGACVCYVMSHRALDEGGDAPAITDFIHNLCEGFCRRFYLERRQLLFECVTLLRNMEAENQNVPQVLSLDVGDQESPLAVVGTMGGATRPAVGPGEVVAQGGADNEPLQEWPSTSHGIAESLAVGLQRRANSSPSIQAAMLSSLSERPACNPQEDDDPSATSRSWTRLSNMPSTDLVPSSLAVLSHPQTSRSPHNDERPQSPDTRVSLSSSSCQTISPPTTEETPELNGGIITRRPDAATFHDSPVFQDPVARDLLLTSDNHQEEQRKREKEGGEKDEEELEEEEELEKKQEQEPPGHITSGRRNGRQVGHLRSPLPTKRTKSSIPFDNSNAPPPLPALRHGKDHH